MNERSPVLLVIEDAQDQAILVSVASRNAMPGLEVHVAENGQQGIDFLSQVAPLADTPARPTPHLVILDLFMPVVDGFGVLEWIRRSFAEAPFPVVVLTGSLVPEHEERARDLGATDVREKPASLDDLGATVREIVTRWIRPGDMIASHWRWLG